MVASGLPVEVWAVEPGALPGPVIDALRAQASATYARSPDLPGYVPTASSAPLDPWRPALDAVCASPVMPRLVATLGPELWCNVEQAWLRRQFPAHLAPPAHAPHSWHQDGALGHHFQGAGDLLHTVTCWCPLDPCGVDAPGIELADVAFDVLLGTGQLTPESTVARVAPVIRPGDVLLMTGGALHRTWVTPAMRSVRTSVELRFYAAVHPRLAGQTHVRAQVRRPVGPIQR